MHPSARFSLACLVLAAAASGCIFDPDDRCGDNQEYDGTRCVCESGYGLIGQQCVACGKHEVGSLAGCACEKGYMRASEGAACKQALTLGAACDTDKDCTDAKYAHCASAADSATGYCTNSDCKSADDCDTMNDYACNDRESPSFCERAPLGLGTSCTKDEDCKDFTASYCEALSSHVCLVNDCKADPNKCHGDWACCDIAVLGASICVPPVEVVDGMCPAGGTLIPRTK